MKTADLKKKKNKIALTSHASPMKTVKASSKSAPEKSEPITVAKAAFVETSVMAEKPLHAMSKIKEAGKKKQSKLSLPKTRKQATSDDHGSIGPTNPALPPPSLALDESTVVHADSSSLAYPSRESASLTNMEKAIGTLFDTVADMSKKISDLQETTTRRLDAMEACQHRIELAVTMLDSKLKQGLLTNLQAAVKESEATLRNHVSAELTSLRQQQMHSIPLNMGYPWNVPPIPQYQLHPQPTHQMFHHGYPQPQPQLYPQQQFQQTLPLRFDESLSKQVMPERDVYDENQGDQDTVDAAEEAIVFQPDEDDPVEDVVEAKAPSRRRGNDSLNRHKRRRRMVDETDASDIVVAANEEEKEQKRDGKSKKKRATLSKARLQRLLARCLAETP